MKRWKRFVVKVGSSTVTKANGKLDLRLLDILSKVLADLKNEGLDVVLVSSGAIAIGLNKMGLSERPKEMGKKQAIAAIGQGELIYLYEKFLNDYGNISAQVLLTKDVFEHSERRENVINTFEALFEMNVIPIVNENDTVAYDEIVYGDNDTLSAMVAKIIKADGLIILSDIDGLYDKNPNEYSDAKLIPKVTKLDESIDAVAGGSNSKIGTGGMATKISAVKIIFDEGIETVITHGKNPSIIYDILDGKDIGTSFKKE